jgi:hypothetical protein
MNLPFMDYSVWSFERAIRDSGDDRYPDRVAVFARAVLRGDESAIRAKANELGVRAHPMLSLPIGIWPSSSVNVPSARGGADAALIRLMFMRDRYVCRYCGTRVIDLRVMEALSRASHPYGPIFPRSKQWRMGETHPAFWWQSGSNDHIVSRSRGGEANDLENLVTACWPCQQRKSHYTLAELGWKLRPIRPGAPAVESNATEWDGLVELLPGLKALGATATAEPNGQSVPNANWKRNTRGAYPARVVGKNPWVYEARNGLWRVKEWPKAPRHHKWELLRWVEGEWKSLAFFPSSDLALKVAADADEGDGIGPPSPLLDEVVAGR